jgi:hypothetical protein
MQLVCQDHWLASAVWLAMNLTPGSLVTSFRSGQVRAPMKISRTRG